MIVAMMTEALAPSAGNSVLEIGTGSGHQTATLSLLAEKIITVERLPDLAEQAQNILTRLGYSNTSFHLVGQSLRYTEGAPFDRLIVSAGASCLPHPLLAQMASADRLVIPVGPRSQQKLLLVQKERSYTVKDLGFCSFEPH